jgi:hypothetical protein
MTDRPADADLDQLGSLVGEWTVELAVDGVPTGRTVFEWALDRTYLVQRTTIPEPRYPDSLVIIAPAADGGYQYHYYDSRGVVRVFGMTLQEGHWTLLRTEPDFSPLDFAQRFQADISPDGKVIDARWEMSHDGGATWHVDFGVTHSRIS